MDTSKYSNQNRKIISLHLFSNPLKSSRIVVLEFVRSLLYIYEGRRPLRPLAITEGAAKMAVTSPTTTPDGEGSEGLSPTQLSLLGLPYGRVASWLWDFFKGEDKEKTTSEKKIIRKRVYVT